MNDGIGKASRLGSFLSVTTWILLLVAVANPKWTTVGNLGTSGGYNTSGTETNATDVTSGAGTISTLCEGGGRFGSILLARGVFHVVWFHGVGT